MTKKVKSRRPSGPPWTRKSAASKRTRKTAKKQDVFAAVRPRLEKALVGLSRSVPEDWARRDLKTTFKPPVDEFPVPDLVLFALSRVLGFPHKGPEEKVRWSVFATFNGALVSFELRKSGFTICHDDDAAVDVKRLRGQLLVAVKHMEKWLEPLAEQQIDANKVSIANHYGEFDKRYRFFRTQADRAYRRAAQPPKKRKPPASPDDFIMTVSEFFAPWNHSIRNTTRGFYHSVAMVDAYFSRLEHQLLLMRALSGAPMPERGLRDFLAKTWDERFREILPIDGDRQVQKAFQKLKGLKERVRNPFSHGGFENDGSSLFVHVPTVGAMPANFTRIKNSVRFNFIPLEKEDHASSCALFDEVDAIFRTGRCAAAFELAAGGISPSFDSKSLQEYGSVVASNADERETYIGQWHEEHDRHANMEY